MTETYSYLDGECKCQISIEIFVYYYIIFL